MANTAEFYDSFFNSCNIRDEVYRGVGSGREGGKPKAGNTIHKVANSSAVSSVGHRNWHRKCHCQPGRTRRSSAAV